MSKNNQKIKPIQSVKDLVFDEQNANLGTERGRAMLEYSFETYGAGRSVLADRNGKLIAGNKSAEVFAENGGEDVIVVQSNGKKLVVVQRTDLDLEIQPEARELAILDNRTSEIDLRCEPAHPKPLSYRYTMREAFGFECENGIQGEHRTLKPGTKLYRLWQWSKKNGATYFDRAHEAMFGTHSMFSHCRTNFDTPCPTVCQSATSLYHPEIPRTLTIPELKRIASFPDDFNFTGSFAQTWERIGNCVPPLMMKSIAEIIRDEILRKFDSKEVDNNGVE